MKTLLDSFVMDETEDATTFDKLKGNRFEVLYGEDRYTFVDGYMVYEDVIYTLYNYEASISDLKSIFGAITVDNC